MKENHKLVFIKPKDYKQNKVNDLILQRKRAHWNPSCL